MVLVIILFVNGIVKENVLEYYKSILVRCFGCVHDGFIYSGSGDRNIVKWDDSGNCICVLEGHTSGVRSLISFKGYLFSGSSDKTIIRWNSEGKKDLIIKEHSSSLKCLCILNDQLISGSC